MGTCYSQHPTSSVNENDNYFPTVGKNRPLRKKLPTYVPNKNNHHPHKSLTHSSLLAMRNEFWDTAPAFEGRKEIWDALKAASEALLNNKDFGMAQAILDGANITLPRGSLSECYDELGNRYRVPAYCLTTPLNLISPSVSSFKDKEENNSVGPCGVGSSKQTQSRNQDRINVEECQEEKKGDSRQIKQCCIPDNDNQSLPQKNLPTPLYSFLTRTPLALAFLKRRGVVDVSALCDNEDKIHLPPSSLILKLRLGAGGTDTELVCHPHSTIGEAKKALARSLISPTTGNRNFNNPSESDEKENIETGADALKTSHTDPTNSSQKVWHCNDALLPYFQISSPLFDSVKGKNETCDRLALPKLSVNSLASAQKWLLAGKVLSNKITLEQAKIPKGFVIQVALCY
ncbi:unnamed protein product [Gordionus sp. m RMFG-2023]|uniref:uncharacterized protein LOC135925659 isoform X2 n=1 Tax=Gordionus sp. m RMFG-2023 TaxID=3053472 RepID=UPI0030E105CA